MQNSTAAKNQDEISFEIEKKHEKLKFCIISSFKSQQCINNLFVFTLDNTY